MLKIFHQTLSGCGVSVNPPFLKKKIVLLMVLSNGERDTTIRFSIIRMLKVETEVYNPKFDFK